MYQYKIPPVIFDVLEKLRILGHPNVHFEAIGKKLIKTSKYFQNNNKKDLQKGSIFMFPASIRNYEKKFLLMLCKRKFDEDSLFTLGPGGVLTDSLPMT